jgi:hypothetical protein
VRDVFAYHEYELFGIGALDPALDHSKDAFFDEQKRRSDCEMEKVLPPRDLERFRIIQDYLFRFYKQFWQVQTEWYKSRGRYFQGKKTMPHVPSFKRDGKVKSGYGLTDQVDDWSAIGYLDVFSPVQLECHVYDGPDGKGYTVFARVKAQGKIWRHKMHWGPEKGEELDNFRWVQED